MNVNFHWAYRWAWLTILIVTSVYSKCYRKINVRWREDGRCGRSYPLSNRRPAECNPKGDRPCCSDFGFCGNSALHCRCNSCLDFRRRPEDLCQIVCDGEEGVLESSMFNRALFSRRDCYFDLQRPSSDYCGVALEVLDLDFGRARKNGECENSWISMPSCLPETETRICGNESRQSYQYLFQRGSHAVRLRVHSEARSYSRSDFRLRYELLRTCSGPYQTQSPPIQVIPRTKNTPCYTRITDLKGTINTPYYPSQYPENLDCVYEFVRTNSNICGVRVKTVRFALEDPISTPFGGACTDFLHVPSCSFLCGKLNSSWIIEYQPGARSLLFHLHTDDQRNGTENLGVLLRFQQTTNCS